MKQDEPPSHHMRPRKPRLLWVGPLRTAGGITVITKRFISDPEVQRRYQVKIQDQGYLGRWNFVRILSPLKVPIGVALILWNMVTFRPAIVHVHTSYRGGFLRDGLIALIARGLGAKVAMTFHSGWKTLPQLYYEGAGWLKQLSRWVIPRVDALVANGPSYEAFLRAEFDHQNIHVMPNPVTDEQIPASMPEYTSRERVVFFAGFLDPRKGVLELIKAAEKVPDARFIIYGEAQTLKDREKFRATLDACRAKDRIQVDIGYGVDKVFKYMEEARLLALPSWGESMPLILEEAMLCGLPVVTTPVGVIADYVQDGVHGYLIEPGDVDALAQAINRILDDPQRALEMSARNRVDGRQFLRSEVHARLFRMYDQLLR